MYVCMYVCVYTYTHMYNINIYSYAPFAHTVPYAVTSAYQGSLSHSLAIKDQNALPISYLIEINNNNLNYVANWLSRYVNNVI